MCWAMTSTFVFGQVRPSVTQVFYSSSLTRGVVNLKPVVPGNKCLMLLLTPRACTSCSKEKNSEVQRTVT